MPFRFYEKNSVFTSSQILLSSGSGTVSNLYDRRPGRTWVTVGENSDANTATISWVPGSSTIIEAILFQNHNFKDFSIIFNSTTSSQFSPALSVTGNTFSNTFYEFASQAVNSIDINIAATHVTNAEKFLGELIICKSKKVELDLNPNAASYAPVSRSIGKQQELIDGGIVDIRLSTKFSVDMTLPLVTSATFDSLTAIWEEHTNFIFVPFFSTFTSYWVGQAEHVVWVGDLSSRFRDNILVNGYTGQISLRQIPN